MFANVQFVKCLASPDEGRSMIAFCVNPGSAWHIPKRMGNANMSDRYQNESPYISLTRASCFMASAEEGEYVDLYTTQQAIWYDANME